MTEYMCDALTSSTRKLNNIVGNNEENAWNCFWSKTWRGTFESLNTIQRKINEMIPKNTSWVKNTKISNALKTKRWELSHKLKYLQSYTGDRRRFLVQISLVICAKELLRLCLRRRINNMSS